MSYKFVLSEETIKEGAVDTWMQDDDNVVGITIGLNKDTGINVYLTEVTNNKGRSEGVMFGKILEDASDFMELLKDRDAMDEVARKWPEFYGMVTAGQKDVYTDAALIGLSGHVMIATKFDITRLKDKDATEYLVEKAAQVLSKCMTIHQEAENNPINHRNVTLKRMGRAAVDGWRSAKRGYAIASVLSKVFLGV